MKTASPHPDWIVPDWPAPANVRALITTRAGGASTGPFASFNLGLRTGDDPVAVAANRATLDALLPQSPRWLRQVHGAGVVEVDGLEGTPEADAGIARRPGTVCGVLVADCIPVLLANRAGTSVAVAHAGWRGLAAGVIGNTIERMAVEPRNLVAYLGPGIGCRGSRLIPTVASGSPAYGQYKPSPDGDLRPWSLTVLEIAGGQIVSMNAFLDTERLFPLFRLPPRLDA